MASEHQEKQDTIDECREEPKEDTTPNTLDINPEVKEDKNGAKVGTKRSREEPEDADLIAAHYNKRPVLDVRERHHSGIINLRNFNNWIKSVLIAEFTSKSRAKTVLDLACGKGGDLPKWKRSRIERLTGIDIAELSIEEARKRYSEMRPHFEATYHVLDAFHKDWKDTVPEGEQFDLISCQFAYHYSFETESSALHSIRMIASHLKEGGYFFGTIPNFSSIRKRLGASRSVENPICSLKLDEGSEVAPGYGQRYYFALEEAIDNCPEYFIPFPVLESIAEDEGLEAVMELPFPEFFTKFAAIPEYRDSLSRMRVVDHEDRLKLSQHELEVAELYMAFCFRKKKT